MLTLTQGTGDFTTRTVKKDGRIVGWLHWSYDDKRVKFEQHPSNHTWTGADMDELARLRADCERILREGRQP